MNDNDFPPFERVDTERPRINPIDAAIFFTLIGVLLVTALYVAGVR